jgi:three-Cys-motif partner protein
LLKARSTAGEHRFGGAHTDDKLARLRAYLWAFTSALKHQEFALIYVDAFAGSGERSDVLPVLPLLNEDNAEPQVVIVPGSARLAIEVEPPFHRLVLVEKNPTRYTALDQLRAEFPDRAIECHKKDANEVVQRLCRRTQWRGSTLSCGTRGVIFLDPYGMEVEWATVAAIAGTRALDLWYYFPLMGLYRQAANRSPAIDATKRAGLNRVLGDDDWEREWYRSPHGPTDLLDDPQTPIRIADVDSIERYVKRRLASIFQGAVLDPLRIHNNQGVPTASLFFAVSNPNLRAVQIATGIAAHILRQPIRRSSGDAVKQIPLL